MNRNELPIRDGADASSADDSEVARVLDAYLAGLEAGRPVNPRQLLAEHPAIADQLRVCLDVMHLANRMDDALDARSGVPRDSSQPVSTLIPFGQSALTTIALGSGSIPQVHLRDLRDEAEPLVEPSSTEMPARNGANAGRYQIQGEIARGGMGAILKGRDVDLGRDLALKVLLASHRHDPEVVRRFVGEAQIGGQLQHPGIVPVYELGTFPDPDRRPYFAMKLVKGQTLAALLVERRLPGRAHKPDAPPKDLQGDPSLALQACDGRAEDLPRFLSIFEAVCQTVAYAHARGVIHRDLKPSNVMVGAFGEVQVMDWGLAKVLPKGGIADERAAGPEDETEARSDGSTVMQTVRTMATSSGSESQAGSVLGTPAYMAPEQARGEVERLDERCDVFGLGAILCEILTGRPPYRGKSREEIREKAARGDLAEAHFRLDGCTAETELIVLAKECLAAEVLTRPRNAGEVAQRMTGHLAGVQERLRSAERARVEAEARADEETKRRALAEELAREAEARATAERKRRLATISMAASILMTATVIVGGWAYLARQRAARLHATARLVTDALADASRIRGQAQAASPGDLTRWFEVVLAARHARDLLAQGEQDDSLQQRVDSMLADLEREQEEATTQATELDRDRKLLKELETIRADRSVHWSAKRTDTEYAAAFRGFGIDLDQLDPNEASKQIAMRSNPQEMASYLDDWAFLRYRRSQRGQIETSWRRLVAVAQSVDPDPWRKGLRDQIGRSDFEAVRRLADDEKELAARPVRSLLLLGSILETLGDHERTIRVLRRAWQIASNDFWVNNILGSAYFKGNDDRRLQELLRFSTAAVAIRPDSYAAHVNLGLSIQMSGRIAEAIIEFREAIRLKPDGIPPRIGLGLALKDQGNLEEAVAEFRTAVRIEPKNLSAHLNLGAALGDLGKLDEAVAEDRATLLLAPDDPRIRDNLGRDLRSRGEFAAAIAELRKARNLASKDPDLAQKIDRELTTTEQLASLEPRLPGILAGRIRPADGAETLGFAQICHCRKLYGASARLWEVLFRDQPNLADDMQAEHRYMAGCAAALAASDQGGDRPGLDESDRTRWRKQAIDWLKADLAYWAKHVETGTSQDRSSIAVTLQHWKSDPDLAGIRDEVALGKLREDEQKAWRALWAEVDALVKKARGDRPRP